MGYEITDTATLELEGGLEVVVKRATTFEEFERIEGIAQQGTGKERDEALRGFAEAFIESWNATSKGVDLPVTDFPRLPLELKFDILSKWMGLMRPDAPLGEGSSDGPDSPEESTTASESNPQEN